MLRVKKDLDIKESREAPPLRSPPGQGDKDSLALHGDASGEVVGRASCPSSGSIQARNERQAGPPVPPPAGDGSAGSGRRACRTEHQSDHEYLNFASVGRKIQEKQVELLHDKSERKERNTRSGPRQEGPLVGHVGALPGEQYPVVGHYVRRPGSRLVRLRRFVLGVGHGRNSTARCRYRAATCSPP